MSGPTQALAQGLDSVLRAAVVEVLGSEIREGLKGVLAEAGRLEALRRKACLTEAEVSALYGIKPGTLRNWRSLKIGPPYVKESGRVLYRQEQLAAWAQANEVVTSG